MRANIGIRRRLAPLLDNSRAEIELINALLLSLPGSPFLYYGDEIGMGDNIWLEDRDAVRTPMQWNPDRNAGFSTADPGKLYLPVIQSLVYNYNMANVEARGRALRLAAALDPADPERPQEPSGLRAGRLPARARRTHDVVLAYLRELPEDNPAGEDTGDASCAPSTSPSTRWRPRCGLPQYAGRGLRDVFGGTALPGHRRRRHARP